MADKSQGSQNSQHSDNFQETQILSRQTHVNNGEKHNDKIQFIPSIMQVTVEIHDKAQTDHFDYHFYDEYSIENVINDVQHLYKGLFIFGITGNVVVKVSIDH